MAAMSYEEARKQRMEENKRRMEELGLMNLSKNLKELKRKAPAKKPEKRKIELQEARRSSRVAAKPVVTYREQLPRGRGGREGKGRQGLRRRYLTEAARTAANEAAEEVFKEIKNPAFVKPLLHSHTSSCFWLGLPADFCEEHMPLVDEKFVLEDEKEKEWECLYLAHKAGLSGGWRGFSLDHDLMDGDCCIFELVDSLRFKVHIIRFEDEEDDSDDSEESDEKKPRLRKARKISQSSSGKKFEVGDDEEDEDEDDDDDEDDDEEEEFDSDVCDDHDSEEVDEDSEDDYSPRLSEKEVDTLVAAPSRTSRVLKREIAKEDPDDSEDDAANQDEIKEEDS